MKERPILFSAPMVRAILDGRKTQTRRILKYPKKCTDFDFEAHHICPDRHGGFLAWAGNGVDKSQEWWNAKTLQLYPNGGGFKCPYGKPGNRLWVRESFFQWVYSDGEMGETAYMDDPQINHLLADMRALKKLQGAGNWKKKPSIHMPRAASRILLEITDIRAERLVAITEADAITEGVEQWPDGSYKHYGSTPGKYTFARDSFLSLWDSIHGEKSHSENPWVWVIDFKFLLTPVKIQKNGR